jgi:YVTN family beta-propeller protein
VVGKLAVVGSRVLVADQSAGRVYVVDVSGNAFIERIGYLNGGTPLNLCGGTIANIPDFAVIPAP